MAIPFSAIPKYHIEAWFPDGEITMMFKTLPEAKVEARKLKAEGAKYIIIHDLTGKNPNGIRV